MTFLWQMETTLPWESYDVFMADGNHFAMDVLWRFYGRWKPLRHGRPVTFLWQMETTSPWASYDVFMADGNHFAMGVLWSFYGRWKPLRHGRPVTFLWPMETTPMRVSMADGNHFTMVMMMSWCLMSSDVSWHIRDKLWPMPKHGSINLYVHGNQ